MACFLFWNVRGFRTSLGDIKHLINKYQPACFAMQETFLKPKNSVKLKFFNFQRKDCVDNARSSGGVLLLTSNNYPSSALPLNTTLQATAAQIFSGIKAMSSLISLPNLLMHHP